MSWLARTTDYGFALHASPTVAGTLSIKTGVGSSAADNLESRSAVAGARLLAQ